MFPVLSTARLGSQRPTDVSGANVDCCTGPDVTTVPPVTLSWYHRGAGSVVLPGFATVCVSHNDSVLPKFVYWFCTIRRSYNESSPLPFFAGTDAGPVVHEASVTLDGPVMVEFAGVAKSAWNFQT